MKNFKIIFLIIILAAAVTVWYAVFYFERHQNLLVTFFDIGQGDAIFIEAPGGNQALIDGGPSNQILSKLGRTLPFWDRSLDLLVLTHPHADHLDGLLEVLKRYEVGLILESGVLYSTSEYQEWHSLLKKKIIPVAIARAGQQVNLGGGIKLEILHPFENFAGVLVKNPHEASVVSRLRYGRNSILLMGDAEKAVEYRLLFESLARPSSLVSNILKIGHHGSRTSSSKDFLRAVSPEVAVIQVGRKNRYGHPHPEVLDALSELGIKILRTDKDGDIKFESNGQSYTFVY